MSDEEEFDGEKTQFWLPGQTPPGLQKGGDAQDPGAEAAVGDAVDFDPTAAVGGKAALDFDLTAEEQAPTQSMDFDITGEGEIEPVRSSEQAPAPQPQAPAPTPPPHTPVQSDAPASGGGTLLVVTLVVAACVAVYLLMR